MSSLHSRGVQEVGHRSHSTAWCLTLGMRLMKDGTHPIKLDPNARAAPLCDGCSQCSEKAQDIRPGNIHRRGLGKDPLQGPPLPRIHRTMISLLDIMSIPGAV